MYLDYIIPQFVANVNRCFARGNSKICCTGTKISPPSEIFNIDVDTINEIILDSKNIDVKAVFYVADAKKSADKGNENPKDVHKWFFST